MHQHIPSLLALCVAVACAAPLDVGSDENTPRSLHEIANAAVAAGRFPSISYATTEGRRIVETATLGFADLGTRAPAGAETLYEAASLTKPVIALLALQAVDAGLLDLDEAVAASVPAARIRDRKRYARVTARHLLSHSAGFPNWSGDSNDPQRVDLLPVEFEPGSAFSYSGEGYAILGQLVEHKTGRGLEALSDELFASLGMRSSTLVGARLAEAGAAASVARGHFGSSPSRPADLAERPVPAFSLITHAGDYARFLAFVATGGGLSEALLEESRRVQVRVRPGWLRRAEGSDQLGWSLGWGVLERSDGPVFFQWGDNGAFRAFSAYQLSNSARSDGARGIVFFVNGSYGLLETNELATPLLGDISPATAWFSSPWLERLRRIVRQ